MTSTRKLRRTAFVFSIALVILSGCTPDSDVARVQISGTVSYGGSPIPFGDVVFTPDSSKQNSGPQGFAKIVDGKFNTTADKGKGIAGGPTICTVTGFSGSDGTGMICSKEVQLNLPTENGVFDIVVPRGENKIDEEKPRF